MMSLCFPIQVVMTDSSYKSDSIDLADNTLAEEIKYYSLLFLNISLTFKHNPSWFTFNKLSFSRYSFNKLLTFTNTLSIENGFFVNL